MSMACGILALNCDSYLTLKLALVLVSSVQASALALKGPGLDLGLGLESPGLGLVLGLEGPGLCLFLGLWILVLTTTLL